MPRKLKGTLTLNILKSVHTSNYPILFSKLYTVATPEHSRPLLLENYIYDIALAPNLQVVSFYYIRELSNYSSTNKFLLLLLLIEGSYPIIKPFLLS